MSSHVWLSRPLPGETCLSCRLKILQGFGEVSNQRYTAALSRPFSQRRYITRGHIRKTKEAEEQWTQMAKEIKEGKRQSFLSVLEERGYINSVVGERDVLDKLITNKRVGIYAGVDPTAPSLHIGHMLPFMVLGWAYVHGLKAVWLLGGATARIGDPTGRTDTRPLMRSTTRKANIVNIHLQLKRLGLSFERYGAKHGFKHEWAWKRALENNNVWWNKQTFSEILSTLGMAVRLGPMLGRDNVKTRVESGTGMSLAEFCYPIMQAWDFWYLFQRGVKVQVGGSDQYGNILFGMDAIKGMLKLDPQSEFAPGKDEDPDLVHPMGITTPLLTTSSGEKYGKSAGNAVWLDKDMTSTFDLYQHFVRTPDDDVERYLKLFTFIPIPEIKEIMETHLKDPSKRIAQHRLARDFVELIHGAEEAEKTAKQHISMFQPKSIVEDASVGTESVHGKLRQQSETAKVHMFEVPPPNLTLPRSLVYQQLFHKVLWSAGMVSTKADGFRLIVNNGVSVGSRSDSQQTMGDHISYVPVKTWPADVTEKFIIDDSLLVLKVGKWKVKTIRIVSDEEYEEMGLSAPGWKAQESKEERSEDKELFSQKRRIGKQQVRLPEFAQKPPPRILHWKPGQEDPVLADRDKDTNGDTQKS